MKLEELYQNKSIVLAEKMNTLQKSEPFSFCVKSIDVVEDTNKSTSSTSKDIDKIDLEIVVNSTNFIDSHSDVHLKGTFKKSARENKTFYLLNNHQMNFENIIADSKNDNLKAEIKEIKASDLGFRSDKMVECLVFKATLSKERNPFMFEQYQKGYVLQHSVGMRYIKVDLAVNSEDEMWKDEKKTWDKYIDEVLNKDVAEHKGYFWAVQEAKFIEGSAVPLGSNIYTPTIQIESKNEPIIEVTQTEIKKEPSSDDTQQRNSFSINQFLN